MSQSDLSNNSQFKQAGAAAVLAAMPAFVFYLLTMSKSLGWHDSAELALVAWKLGASHAPGSPLHSLFGHLTAQMFAKAFIGTNLLSVLAATISVGGLAFLATVLTGNLLIAVCAALLYAFSYQVWTSAVITEVYSLGTMFFCLTMVFAWIWQKDYRPRSFVLMAAFYALSLSAYFANILLLPAFFCYIFVLSASRVRDLVVFLLITACAICIIAYANYQLALIFPPFGEILPDSLGNMILYMSGSQHDPLALGGLAEVVGRFWQHGKIFSKSVLFISVPIGILGSYFLVRANKFYGGFLLLAFAIYFFYYTVFGPGDYYMMVLPAYFVFAICFACGVVGALRRTVSGPLRLFVRSTPVLLVVVLILIQISPRYVFATVADAEEFAAATFAELPKQSVAIVGWKEFSTLRYMQEVEDQRSDIRVIVPARSFRQYRFSAVDDYLLLIADEICSSPILTIKPLADLPPEYSLAEPAANSRWRKISLSKEAFSARCSQEEN